MAVVDYGSVIKAAERLHLSQPSISAGLKALEQELGRPLFDRSGPANRPLRLTPAGRRFYRDAHDILKQCEGARSAFLGESDTGRRVRVGVLDTISREVITETLRVFEERDPVIQIEIWEGSINRLAGWLAQERINIAWMNVNDLTPNARVLWREPLVAVVAPDHPFADLSGISVRDLAKQPFVHRSLCELDAIGRARLKAAGVKLDVRARAEREDLAFQLIRAGKYLTLAPKSIVPHDLVSLEVSGLNVERSVGLQWHEQTDSAHVLQLSDAVREATNNNN